MTITYQIKCPRCRKNRLTVTNRQRFAVCYDCQKQELSGTIKDPALKAILDIPEDFYRKNAFLRDIKANAIKYEKLSDKQIEAFKKVVKKMKEEKTDRPIEPA